MPPATLAPAFFGSRRRFSLIELLACPGVVRRTKRSTAFSLIELLVVVAVIALLASLLLPALSLARDKAQGAVCRGNLRSLGQAMQMYGLDAGRFPPAWQGTQVRWMDLIKPFIDKKSGVYLCPLDRQRIPVLWDAEITQSFGLNTFNFAGNQYCFWYGVALADVARPAGTILLADSTPGLYYCGGGAVFGTPVPRVDYRHAEGAFQALFCDGHVEARTTTIKTEWDASQ